MGALITGTGSYIPGVVRLNRDFADSEFYAAIDNAGADAATIDQLIVTHNFGDVSACQVELDQLKKIFIHQANEKMDAAIVRVFYRLFQQQQPPEGIMPMNIRNLGNSSVATIPTLFDMVRRAMLPGHRLYSGDVVLFASVGAGMNINALCYRI